MIQRWEVILVSQRQKKQVGIGKFMRESASNAGQFVNLEKLVAMNATKTELKLYT